MNKQQGYILLMTFSMLAMSVAIVSMFMIKGMTHKKFASALLQQEQIRTLLLSTPALAQSFFSVSPLQSQDAQQTQKVQDLQASSDEEKKSTDASEQIENAEQDFLKKILPVVNISQKFMLKELESDFPIVLDLIFFCESGKININGLYDLIEKKFYNEGVENKDQKVFVTWLFDKIAVLTEKPSLLPAFTEHVKQRKVPFNDVTELLAIKEFATCFDNAIFYNVSDNTNESVSKRTKLFLTDIFTVSSESDTIQPWLLSPGLCALLDIPQKKNDQNSFEKKEKDVDLSGFKVQADWQKDWDKTIKSMYTITYDKIPKIVQANLAKEFKVSTISMIAKVRRDSDDGQDSMRLGIYAILKEKKLQDGSTMYDVIKMYQI
ncbi:MAG: hypothetical protein ACXWL2_00980 [Candidatus Chromulinivorax sp.]